MARKENTVSPIAGLRFGANQQVEEKTEEHNTTNTAVTEETAAAEIASVAEDVPEDTVTVTETDQGTTEPESDSVRETEQEQRDVPPVDNKIDLVAYNAKRMSRKSRETFSEPFLFNITPSMSNRLNDMLASGEIDNKSAFMRGLIEAYFESIDNMKKNNLE